MPDDDVYLALALANSSHAAGDPLTSPTGVARWLEARGLGPAAPETALRGLEFRELRDLVRDALGAVAAGRAPSPAALRRLNDAARSAPVVVELEPETLQMRETFLVTNPTVRALGALARASIRLLGSEARERMRRCPAPRCGRFFLAERADRVWCSAVCGNRARVARHLARRREAHRAERGSHP